MGYDNPLQNEYEGITATTEHESAARGEGERWQYVETAATAELRIGEITLRPHWTGLADGNEIRALFKQVVTEHNSHTALVEQRDRALRMWADLQRDNEELQRWAGERMKSLAKSLADVAGERNEAREERDRLREALRRILKEAEYVADAKAPFSTWVAESCRAALNDQKDDQIASTGVDQKGGEG